MSATRFAVRLLSMVLAATAGCIAAAPARAEDKPAETAVKVIRAGLVGVDTSHATAFTDLFNAAKPLPELAGIKVVAAFPSSSPDLKASAERVQGYTEALRKKGVEIVDSMPALLEKVDVVLVESVERRKHLELARPVIEAGKPLFIDKPLAASLADGVAIAELAKKHNVAWFCSSALRFSPGIAAARTDPKFGGVVGCDAWSPCPLNDKHPDLFWYGVHGVETLFTIMGPGCVSVSRTNTPDTDHVTGVWSDGRIGTFRGLRGGKADYGATVFGAKSIGSAGTFGGYQPLVVEIAKFIKTGKPPVTPEESLQMLAFMEAADESKRQDGKPVTLESVMVKAKEQVAARK